MREILAELTEALEQRRPCVYCTVVETRGSTPQKAGASMLVFADASQRGTLGGGCVEAEVKRRALHVLAHGGQTELLSFCLDDDYGWDDGLICGGRMNILADPLTNDQARPIAYYSCYRQLIEQGKGCTEAVIVSKTAGGPVGTRYLFDSAGLLVAQLAGEAPPAALLEDLTPLVKRPGPAVRQGIAYLPILPRITLLIVGGGHVGQAVGKLAAEVDFDVWVLDDRERYASRERFPMAQNLLVGDIGATLKGLAPKLDESFFCLIVTRGHSHDEEALFHLASTRASYVGMIGSKRKIRLIHDDLLHRGVSPEVLERVHAPLGFAIGSQTVPEIAVSIVAELIGCRNLNQHVVEPRSRTIADLMASREAPVTAVSAGRKANLRLELFARKLRLDDNGETAPGGLTSLREPTAWRSGSCPAWYRRNVLTVTMCCVFPRSGWRRPSAASTAVRQFSRAPPVRWIPAITPRPLPLGASARPCRLLLRPSTFPPATSNRRPSRQRSDQPLPLRPAHRFRPWPKSLRSSRAGPGPGGRASCSRGTDRRGPGRPGCAGRSGCARGDASGRAAWQ